MDGNRLLHGGINVVLFKYQNSELWSHSITTSSQSIKLCAGLPGPLFSRRMCPPGLALAKSLSFINCQGDF